MRRRSKDPSPAVRAALGGRNALLFGLPIGQSVPPEVTVFWLHVLNERRFITRLGAYSIAAAHNQMVEQMLALPPKLCDYLVWLETDHTFNAQEVFLYIEHLDPRRYPVVGFLYMERGLPCLPVGFDKGEDGAMVRWDEERMKEFARRPGLHQVSGGVPMGVTAIHRSVFEKVPEPWFYDPPDGSMSDDIWFCQQAIAAGFPVHVCNLFVIDHWGSMAYNVNHYWAGREANLQKVPLLAETMLRKRLEAPQEQNEERFAGDAARPVPVAAPESDRTGEGGEPEPAYTYRDKRGRVTA